METARLLLRPCTPADIDDLHRHWIDPGVRKFLWDDQIIPRETAVAVVEASLASFAERGFGFWCVSFKGAPALLGFCGLREFDEDDPAKIEILYGIAPEHWGKALAVEAAQAVLRYGFEEAGLPKIYAGADPPNVASIRVMEKLGMAFDHRRTINGLKAIYYALTPNACQIGDLYYRLLKP
jgi:RimJ/RimL family protein N-acetyltransferase